LDETKVQDPAFHTLKEARNKIFTKQYQSQPIFDSDGNIIAVFQLEAKYRSILQATDTRLAIQKSIRRHIGFSFIDEQVMNLISLIIGIKQEQVMSVKIKKKVQKEVLSTIKLSSAICS